MGYSYFPIETLPNQYDVVWCLYPESRLTPGPVVRPSLVLDVRIEPIQKIGALIVAYGTGVVRPDHFKEDLVIIGSEYAALGLHKITRFALGLNSRMILPWCSEYFAPQPYNKSQGIIAGSLTQVQMDRMFGCFTARGLKPY